MPGPPIKVLFQAAIRDARLPAGVKLVGLVLSTYMRSDGCAWPSVGAIATAADRSARQVFRALRELESAGLVEIVQRPGQRSTYLATPDTGVTPTPDTGVSNPGHFEPVPLTRVSPKGFEGGKKGPRANGRQRFEPDEVLVERANVAAREYLARREGPSS